MAVAAAAALRYQRLSRLAAVAAATLTSYIATHTTPKKLLIARHADSWRPLTGCR